MSTQQNTKIYWGIGLENETYLQFENSLEVSGTFVQEKIGCERYSIDYRKCYKSGALAPVLEAGFDKNKTYTVTRMINSHSLDKIDLNFQHRTVALTNPLVDNPAFLGKSILEVFLEGQPYNIKSMLTQKNNPMGSVNFDGDSIEFVTKYFENRTINESCNELKATKQLFIDKFNESEVLGEKLHFPNYNSGLNMFMSNQENIVLFNNGTYHIHLTLPSLTENSRIVDYPRFDAVHSNAIYLLQWFEPLFIATLGSPDIMAVISQKYNLKEKFAMGSMRNAMSRYTGVGTFNKSMAKGKILTYQVEEFRKLLKFEKEENIWWRDQIEHALDLPDVMWGHDSVVWNNLVFKSLRDGFAAEINEEEKTAVLELLNLLNSSDFELKAEFAAITHLDAFFFKILEVLHARYKDNNTCLDALCGEKTTAPPQWPNFNKYQIEQHLKQIEGVG